MMTVSDLDRLMVPAIRNRDEWYCVASYPDRLGIDHLGVIGLDPDMTPVPVVLCGQCDHCGGWRELGPGEEPDPLGDVYDQDAGTWHREEPVYYDEPWDAYRCGACGAAFPIVKRAMRDVVNP